MKIKTLLFGALLAGNVFAFEVSTLPNIASRETPDISENKVYSFYDSIKEAKKGVVNISTQKKVKATNIQGHPLLNDPFFRQFFGDAFGAIVPKDRIERSLGSGVIISSDGYIVTNNHVVEGADKIIVSLPDSNKEYEAKIIGRDEKSDLAIVKINAKNLPFLKFASSDDLQVGDVVFAIGNPFGVGESVTQGIISALNKSGIGINDYENFIQTDASINPGNSGGALVDSRGGLIGINTAILSRTGGNHGIGFAIPSEMVKKISKALIEDGVIERGYLGVSIQDISGDLKEVYKNQNGAVVISIENDSPAQKSGLKVWDLITKVNGKPIRSAAELKNYIGTFSPKDKINLTIIRDKKEQNLTLTLAKLSTAQSVAKEVGSIQGLEVSELTPTMKENYGIPSNIQGIFISQVAPNSKAEELGFREGDIIVQIESFSISDLKSFNDALKRYKGQPKRMLINRGGRIFSIVAK
ncbi:DegQ family serine endoprotease [Helicobacter sp. 14348-15]|uniref:DegQ family serine endoprotease n=1 Tax=Helicobacter TaxID=209 RepID=UPI00202B1A5D|nr:MULTISPECIES: DegQ family serine endoprotease [Helicobacter]MCI7765019.1 DegQ family serine endoprotease [Helicobacter sp.]MCL9820800.1 DegQ family serine endoprotease [Helicobacter colisuis]